MDDKPDDTKHLVIDQGKESRNEQRFTSSQIHPAPDLIAASDNSPNLDVAAFEYCEKPAYSNHDSEKQQSNSHSSYVQVDKELWFAFAIKLSRSLLENDRIAGPLSLKNFTILQKVIKTIFLKEIWPNVSHDLSSQRTSLCIEV